MVNLEGKISMWIKSSIKNSVQYWCASRLGRQVIISLNKNCNYQILCIDNNIWNYIDKYDTTLQMFLQYCETN